MTDQRTHPELPATPFVVGHRGSGRSFKPQGTPTHNLRENTRASFAAAHADGAAWVELDVVASLANDLFLWHDHFIDGIPVHRASSALFEAHGAERFENLGDDLPAGLGVDVEVKALPFSRLTGRHGEHLILEQAVALAQHRPVVWSSFDPTIARTGKEAGLRAAWITKEGYSLYEAVMGAANLGVDAIVVHGYTTLEEATWPDMNQAWQIVRDTGLKVWCWDVTPAKVPNLVHHGVTGFCTDRVPEVAELLRLMGSTHD